MNLGQRRLPLRYRSVISRPVPLPLRPILRDPETGEAACTCRRGADCSRIGKHAALWEWRDLSYGDEVQTPEDGAGVALKTGAHPRGSDVFVVDLDGPEAIEAWAALGGLPEGVMTRVVKTGRPEGGLQLYFKHPGFPVASSQSALAPKIDIRGENGLAVCEGSPHASSAEARYELLTPEDLPPAPAPAWLLEWLSAREAPALVRAYASDVSDPVEREHRRALYTEYLATTPHIRSEDNRGKGDKLLFDVVQYGAYDLALPTEDVLELVSEIYDPRNDRPWGSDLEERVLHKAHDAKTSSTRPRIGPLPSPEKDPLIAALFAPADLGMREFTLEDLEPLEPGAAHPDGLGFRFGGWGIEPPPVEYLVDGLIPVGDVGMFYGAGDGLKTWLVYHMGLAISRGQPWLGRSTKKARVGIVDYETGESNLGRRLYMLRAGEDPNLGATSFPDGEKPNDWNFWQKLAKDDFDIVFVDSLRQANPGANENDSAEAILPLVHAAQFTEVTAKMGRPCAVVFIHHAKRESSSAREHAWPEMRGSSAIQQQVGFMYAVKKKDISPERKRVDVKNTKPGEMRQPEPFAVDVTFDDIRRCVTLEVAGPEDELEEGSGGGGSAPAERELGDDEIQRKILFSLSNGPVITKTKLRVAVGGRRERIYAEIEAMEEAGTIAFVRGRGYDLESPERRRVRVFEQVDDFDRWPSAAKLANAAEVPTPFVEGMLREGYLVPKASGQNPNGYLIARRE